MYWEKAEDKSSSFPGIGPKAPETCSGGTDSRQLARSASWPVQVYEMVSLSVYLATRWWPRFVALQKALERRW